MRSTPSTGHKSTNTSLGNAWLLCTHVFAPFDLPQMVSSVNDRALVDGAWQQHKKVSMVSLMSPGVRPFFVDHIFNNKVQGNGGSQTVTKTQNFTIENPHEINFSRDYVKMCITENLFDQIWIGKLRGTRIQRSHHSIIPARRRRRVPRVSDCFETCPCNDVGFHWFYPGQGLHKW